MFTPGQHYPMTKVVLLLHVICLLWLRGRMEAKHKNTYSILMSYSSQPARFCSVTECPVSLADYRETSTKLCVCVCVSVLCELRECFELRVCVSVVCAM